MNKILEKSFDNLMYQQTKMDNKAYIFIGFITLVFTFMYPDTQSLDCYSNSLIILVIPLIISLIPITTIWGIKILDFFIREKKKKVINIFYYVDIFSLNVDVLIKALAKDYGMKNISKAEVKLVDQIIINSRILRSKVFFHNIFFILLGFKYLLQQAPQKILHEV